MDYVGLDPMVGLECARCRSINRMPYSDLLSKVTGDAAVCCDSCGMPLAHDWTTINVVQNIIRRRMRQAQEEDRTRVVPGNGTRR
jgi:hypothetical protein